MQQTSEEPIVFRTLDGLLTFTFTLGDPSDAHATMVTAEIAISAGPSEPAAHGPITVAIYQDGPTQLAHGAGNGSADGDGYTVAGTLALEPQGHRQIAIVADLFYGERGSQHLAGVLGSFTVSSCHAPAWVLCGCAGSAHGDVTGRVAGHLAA